jgi:sterol desaturase/sphingolipid hydroxylase (fatty acid hydroxylase superfamily)
MNIFESFWKDRKHHLNRMTLGELTKAYFQYPAVVVYIVLLVISSILALELGKDPFAVRFPYLALAVIASLLLYPFVWYLLHRFVLHGRYLYRSSKTASLWKRIHFDHHQDPNDLRVLFGALYTTLPTVGLVTITVGSFIGGSPAAAAAFAGGLVGTLIYEYCHCIQHLHYLPKWRFLRRIKRLHLLHHFHNENGNFGITNFLWDRIAGTFYNQAADVPSSKTVFNLGYCEEECSRYPWVAQLSETSGPAS